ncbi:MAG TPA: glycosyl transferase family 1, partial [Myxococcota bacterium]|nr:glycosyl transferase family 1 [Myxococcota bacterium]
MKRGYHPIAYYSNPNVSKPLDDIFTDINEFTDEVFPHETERFGNLAVFILLPPLLYDGHFVKGILFTQGAELLIERFPWIQEVFHIYAYSMWSSFPQSTRADGLFMSYPNPARVEWFRTKYPERAHQVLVPLCDSDFFNEYSLVPKLSVKKDIDILCVARLDLVKNLPMFAQALKVLRQKYPATPMRATLLTGANFDINWNGLEEREKAELRKINQALGST